VASGAAVRGGQVGSRAATAPRPIVGPSGAGNGSMICVPLVCASPVAGRGRYRLSSAVRLGIDLRDTHRVPVLTPRAAGPTGDAASRKTRPH